ncbi:MAG: type II secretion system F family protein [Planctomycetota bacterium]|jgi:type IV pilus assembly protein PilC
MLLSPRIKIGQLAGLCRRLATALGAGIDVRRAWAREADRASGWAARGRFRIVSEAVHRGESMSEALAATGNFFPPLLRELVEVGEKAGHLSEVFARLAEHYEGRLKLRLIFLGAIAWPLIQLAAAVLLIGFLIWFMGDFGGGADPLRFGLVGIPGLVKYVAFLATVGVLFVFILQAARRGLAWTRPIQRVVLRLPVLGKALQTVALARLAWALHLALNTEMEVRRALRLSLRSSGNALFTDRISVIEAEIGAGNSIHEAFLAAGCFPADFLDAIAVGEQSGRLVESMGRISGLYQDQARAALAVLTTLASFAVWALIAAILVFLIFRLASFVFGIYDEVLQW